MLKAKGMRVPKVEQEGLATPAALPMYPGVGGMLRLAAQSTAGPGQPY